MIFVLVKQNVIFMRFSRGNFDEGFLVTFIDQFFVSSFPCTLIHCVHDVSFISSFRMSFGSFFPFCLLGSCDFDFLIFFLSPMQRFKCNRPNERIIHICIYDYIRWKLSCDTKNNQDELCVNMQSIYYFS